MKNKIIGIFMVAVSVFLIMSACGSSSYATSVSTIVDQPMFSVLESNMISSYSTYYILVDNDTGIEYVYFESKVPGSNTITNSISPLYKDDNNSHYGYSLKQYK